MARAARKSNQSVRPRTDYLERILKARVYDVAVESALEVARHCRGDRAIMCCSSAKINKASSASS
jgi:hypothetical protein